MNESLFLDQLLAAKKAGEKCFALLLDPDKTSLEELRARMDKINASPVDFLFIGGSTMEDGLMEAFLDELKRSTYLPLVIFPGSHNQVCPQADALMFLNLISGRNPEYLIEQQIKAVPKLEKTNLEVVPTAYLLVDGGVETAVQRISKTLPMDPNEPEKIVHTAMAGAYMGNKILYLEAGSGAKKPVSDVLIRQVHEKLTIPLVVGGGIRTADQIDKAFKAGADLIVLGTVFEENQNIFEELYRYEHIG